MNGKATAAFHEYFRKQMRTPEFAKAYRDATSEIEAVDRVMRRLEKARLKVRLTKAELARRADVPQESVRRLFTARRSNPTLQTIVRLARVLGLRVELMARTARERTTATMKKDREPSKKSLREMPEVDFAKAKVRRNPYAARRIAAEGITISVRRKR
jgi:transcriptional regulator with XRE-family HTH domain